MDRTRVAENLRNAAAWLNLAADRLDEHQDDDAGRMVRVGLFAARDVPEELTTQVDPSLADVRT